MQIIKAHSIQTSTSISPRFILLWDGSPTNNLRRWLYNSSSQLKKFLHQVSGQSHFSPSQAPISLIVRLGWSETWNNRGKTLQRGANPTNLSSQNFVDPPLPNFFMKISCIQSLSTPRTFPKPTKSLMKLRIFSQWFTFTTSTSLGTTWTWVCWWRSIS
jgi:hypothetical protein